MYTGVTGEAWASASRDVGQRTICLAAKNYRPARVFESEIACSRSDWGERYRPSVRRSRAGRVDPTLAAHLRGTPRSHSAHGGGRAPRRGERSHRSRERARSLSGFTEFLSQGTTVHTPAPPSYLFSTSASGTDLYCHLDAGYQPMRFAMGNIAYALGIGAGVSGMFRSLGRGEVHEFSQMYNQIRHTALARLQAEAAQLGANSVVDLKLRMLPMAGAIELLITGTASYHPRFSPGPVRPEQVVTSELTGEELSNLAQLGYAPVRLVMATSVYSIGLTGSVGVMFKGMRRGGDPRAYASHLSSAGELSGAHSAGGDPLRSGARDWQQAHDPGPRWRHHRRHGGRHGRPAPRRDDPSDAALIPRPVIVNRESVNLEGSLATSAPAAPSVGTSRSGCLVALAIGIMTFAGILMAVAAALVSQH